MVLPWPSCCIRCWWSERVRRSSCRWSRKAMARRLTVLVESAPAVPLSRDGKYRVSAEAHTGRWVWEWLQLSSHLATLDNLSCSRSRMIGASARQTAALETTLGRRAVGKGEPGDQCGLHWFSGHRLCRPIHGACQTARSGRFSQIALHEKCHSDVDCESGECVKWSSGDDKEHHTCEIECNGLDKPSTCPLPLVCAGWADGPGQICGQHGVVPAGWMDPNCARDSDEGGCLGDADLGWCRLCDRYMYWSESGSSPRLYA
jgi:hypothetical protein